MMIFGLIQFLRALTFGGLIGSGLVIILYLLYPQLFVGHLSFEFMLVFGGLLGASIHRILDALIVKGLLDPIGRSVSYRQKLNQIEMLKRSGDIDEATAHKIKKELAVKYFIESDSFTESPRKSRRKSLPPE
jgi:hypothetical protein